MVDTRHTPNVRKVHDYIDALGGDGNDLRLIGHILAASANMTPASLTAAERDEVLFKNFARYLERIAIGEDNRDEACIKAEEEYRQFRHKAERLSSFVVQESRQTLYGTLTLQVGRLTDQEIGQRVLGSYKALKRHLGQTSSQAVEQLGSSILHRYLAQRK